MSPDETTVNSPADHGGSSRRLLALLRPEPGESPDEFADRLIAAITASLAAADTAEQDPT